MKLGLSLATFLGNEGEIVVASDARTSSEALKNALSSGLMSGGCAVADLDLVPLPVFAYTTRERRSKAGVIVTGSHNPPQDNGLKCCDERGMEYTPREEEALEGLVFNEKYKLTDWKKVGDRSYVANADEEYVEAVLHQVPKVERKIKVLVDCANGTASNVTPMILSKLGCKVFTINSSIDGAFPGRLPEPSPENLRNTCRLVREIRANIGIAHDGDADRLAVIDDRGRYITNDSVLALFAKLLLERHGGGHIVTSVDTSFRIDQVVEKVGGTLERTRLGKTHVILKEKLNAKIILCCEPWKIIDTHWGYWEDAIYAASRLIKLLDESKGSTAELFKEIPNYPQQRVYHQCPDSLKQPTIALIQQKLSEEKGVASIWTYDGIRVNYEDNSWVLIRPSGTEPKIRIYCEGVTTKRLNQLAKQSISLVKAAINKAEKQRS
jgi:phosphoglucosamine mutase